MKDIIKLPKILIPKNNVNLTDWAVVACDQFTSQKSYWEKLDGSVGEVSALRVVYPEVYLEENNQERLNKISSYMKKYVKDNIFDSIENKLILVERECSNGLIRLGLMLAVNLDAYEFSSINDAPIKATEATVKSRLPIRIEIRENASLELPHIMLLMDDNDQTIIEPLYNNRKNLKKIYDFKLNMGGGHLTGYVVENSNDVVNKILALADENVLIEKYKDKKKFLFGVGDGNHSLAAAKLTWEKIKKTLSPSEIENHPAKYCLCELVNLHCEGLLCEPIHRVIFNSDLHFIESMQKALKGDGKIKLVLDGKDFFVNVDKDERQAIIDIQAFIDEYIENNKKVEIDYIHGNEHLLNVAKEKKGIAIFMPKIEKSKLFYYILKYGALPRKAFSLGEAEDKRYYMEARIIK